MMAVLRIKELMGQKGISRKDLAKKVKVSETTISNICSETNLPTIKLLLKIAKALDADIRELFVSTKGDAITQSEVTEATDLIAKGLSILNGNN